MEGPTKVAGAAGNLEEACSPANLPFPPPPEDLKPGTSGVGGERKAPLIPFINKANEISHAPKRSVSLERALFFTLTLSSGFPLPLLKQSC